MEVLGELLEFRNRGYYISIREMNPPWSTGEYLKDKNERYFKVTIEKPNSYGMRIGESIEEAIRNCAKHVKDDNQEEENGK